MTAYEGHAERERVRVRVGWEQHPQKRKFETKVLQIERWSAIFERTHTRCHLFLLDVLLLLVFSVCLGALVELFVRYCDVNKIP